MRKNNIKIHNEKTIFEVKINFRHLQLFLFLVFGFYGWGTSNGLNLYFSIIELTLTILLVVAILSIIKNKTLINSMLDNKLIFKLKHIYALSLIFLILILANNQKINRDLTGDELSYTLNSIEHSLGILDRIFIKLPTFIQNQSASLSIQLATLLILSLMLLFANVILRIKEDKLFMLVILVLTILFRIIITTEGGKNYPNSPVPSFLSFITTSIFGVNSLTYRLTMLFIFANILTYIFFRFSIFGLHGYVFAFLTMSLFITSPLLSYTVTSIEIANYTLIVGLICLIEFYRTRFLVNPKLLLFLSAAFYLRVNIIALLIIFFILHLYQNKSQLSHFLNLYKIIFSIVSPGIVITFENRLKNRVSSELNFHEEISSNSFNFISAIINSRNVLLFIFALISLVILFSQKKYKIFAFLYIFVNFLLYFVINSSELTKEVKYLTEYLFPLSLTLGMLTLIKFEKMHVVKIALIVLMTLTNLQGLSDTKELKYNFITKQIETQYSSVDSEIFLSFKPLPYSQIFGYTKDHDLKRCFNSGIVYGVTPEIMAGYSLNDVHYLLAQRSNFLKVQSSLNEEWTSISPESASISKIECVIIGNVDNKKIILESFLKARWVLLANFTESNFGTKAFILINK